MGKYFEQHGSIGEYFWFESNGICIAELLVALPEIVEGNHVIRTRYDSEGLVPYGRPPGVAWEKWQQLGQLGIIASVNEINPTDYDQYFVYRSAPDPSIFTGWSAIEPAFTLATMSEPEAAETLLRALHKLLPVSYVGSQRFVTSDGALLEQLLASELVTGLPTKYPYWPDQYWQKYSGEEVGPETCKSKGCDRLRIKLGIFCARHHLEMLNGTACDFD